MTPSPKEKKELKNELIKMTLLNCRVCSNGTWDDALEWVRMWNMAGTSNNWQKARQKNQRPVACEKGNGFTHYMFVC